jgi:hypothetical protein
VGVVVSVGVVVVSVGVVVVGAVDSVDVVVPLALQAAVPESVKVPPDSVRNCQL